MIGIVTDHISNNIKNYLMFRELNKLSKTQDCYLFANSIESLPMKNEFCILQQVEAMSHAGTLMSTSLITTQIVQNALPAKRKIFYMWYPDWSDYDNIRTTQLTNILTDKSIEIVTRGTDQAKLMESMFGRECGILRNWDSESLERLVS